MTPMQGSANNPRFLEALDRWNRQNNTMASMTQRMQGIPPNLQPSAWRDNSGSAQAGVGRGLGGALGGLGLSNIFRQPFGPVLPAQTSVGLGGTRGNPLPTTVGNDPALRTGFAGIHPLQTSNFPNGGGGKWMGGLIGGLGSIFGRSPQLNALLPPRGWSVAGRQYPQVVNNTPLGMML